MMSLIEQVLSFAFSFLYGHILGIIFYKMVKYLYINKKIYRALNSLLFCIDATLIYFCVFRLINNGIINYYFIFITLISSIIVYKRKFTQKMSK